MHDRDLKPSPEPEVAENTFLQEGEYWTIAYEGTVFRLRDVKGLHCLAYLLGHAGQRFHAGDLLFSIHGEASRASWNAERARVVVTKRIKAALKKVAVHHRGLGYHLTTCVKTGYQCAYLPNPELTVSWRVSASARFPLPSES